MNGFVDNIEELAIENENFRKVLFTGQNSQLVVMSLKPNEDIGMETHENVDQFIRIEEGEGKAILNNEEFEISDGSAILIPAGTEHNIINTDSINPMKLYTLYSPPEHPDKTVQAIKPA